LSFTYLEIPILLSLGAVSREGWPVRPRELLIIDGKATPADIEKHCLSFAK